MPDQVLLTHHHHDHVLGLHALAKLGPHPAALHEGVRAGRAGDLPAARLPRDAGDAGRARSSSAHGLRAQAFDVDHSGNTRTVAYRFTGPGGESLVYAPDLAGPPGSKLAKGPDLLMLGAATRDRTVKDHMPMTEGIECARKLKPGRTLFTHVGHRIGTHAELEAWVPEGFGIAYDGLEIELG